MVSPDWTLTDMKLVLAVLWNRLEKMELEDLFGHVFEFSSAITKLLAKGSGMLVNWSAVAS